MAGRAGFWCQTGGVPWPISWVRWPQRHTETLTKLLGGVKKISSVESLACGECFINIGPLSPSQMFMNEETDSRGLCLPRMQKWTSGALSPNLGPCFPEDTKHP